MSFCTFKSYQKKYLSSSYFEFLEKIEKFRIESEKAEYARFQHYRAGQKFHYYTLTDELKKIILGYDGIKVWQIPYLPEDIAFYNGKTAWFFAIRHEEIYYLNTDFPKLIDDLLNMGVKLEAVKI